MPAGSDSAVVVGFSAASATPRAVFPRLLRNARHHARKAKDDPRTRGTAWWLDRMIDDIANGLAEGQAVRKAYGGTVTDARDNAFPAYLPLEQQGLFARWILQPLVEVLGADLLH